MFYNSKKGRHRPFSVQWMMPRYTIHPTWDHCSALKPHRGTVQHKTSKFQYTVWLQNIQSVFYNEVFLKRSKSRERKKKVQKEACVMWLFSLFSSLLLWLQALSMWKKATANISPTKNLSSKQRMLVKRTSRPTSLVSIGFFGNSWQHYRGPQYVLCTYLASCMYPHTLLETSCWQDCLVFRDFLPQRNLSRSTTNVFPPKPSSLDMFPWQQLIPAGSFSTESIIFSVAFFPSRWFSDGSDTRCRDTTRPSPPYSTHIVNKYISPGKSLQNRLHKFDSKKF